MVAERPSRLASACTPQPGGAVFPTPSLQPQQREFLLPFARQPWPRPDRGPCCKTASTSPGEAPLPRHLSQGAWPHGRIPPVQPAFARFKLRRSSDDPWPQLVLPVTGARTTLVSGHGRRGCEQSLWDRGCSPAASAGKTPPPPGRMTAFSPTAGQRQLSSLLRCAAGAACLNYTT